MRFGAGLRMSGGRNNPQASGCGGVEFHAGLLKNPPFNALVVDPQQVQRETLAMLFGGRAGLVALNLCHHAGQYL